MKKLVSLLLAGAIGASCAAALAGCGGKDQTLDTTPKDTPLTPIANEAHGLDNDALLAKAKEEKGDFVAYGNTSRITTAMDNFIKSDYGKALGLSSSNASAKKQSDTEIYTLLDAESKSANKNKNASMVLIQDSASLKQYASQTTLLTNYIPKGMEQYVDEEYRVPFAHQFINKLFMYNTSGDTNVKFTNVWQLTDASYKDKIFFKSPKTEQVNMNFLIMLTNEEWSGKLESAYKSLKGSAASDVGKGKTYENYGYKWIAEFLANCNFSITSDTTIAQKLSTTDNAGKMGLFVLSKLRDSSVYGDNLQVSAWDKAEGSSNYQKIDPFAGFMYSIYAQLATNGPRPYTAMLFINYLMTDDGFTPWKSLGGYSSNSQIPVYEKTGGLTVPNTATVGDKEFQLYKDNNGNYMIQDGKNDAGKAIYKYVTVADGEGTLTGTQVADGDKITVGDEQVALKATAQTKSIGDIKDSPLSFWKENLVVEDGDYVLRNSVKVTNWIDKQLDK